jgi:anti-sigma regulatory factor (Ser/Thr protein kinase)
MATVSPSWAYTLQLPHDPRAPGIARGTLRLILAAHGTPELTPTAELVAAELLANAHCHTKGPYALRLRAADHGRLRVTVWDTDPHVPPGFSTAPAPPPHPTPSMAAACPWCGPARTPGARRCAASWARRRVAS